MKEDPRNTASPPDSQPRPLQSGIESGSFKHGYVPPTSITPPLPTPKKPQG